MLRNLGPGFVTSVRTTSAIQVSLNLCIFHHEFLLCGFILWALEGGVVQVAMSVALDEVETGATEFTNTYINIITCF